MFHVYQTTIDGPFKTIDTSHAKNAREVDQLIGEAEKLEPGSVNWFGASAKAVTPELAVAEAKVAGFRYREPGRMLGLIEQAASLGATAQLKIIASKVGKPRNGCSLP